jgi:prophage regulatory protein|tara:strand:+ start:170 stop:427 length:258 start_codon:yes stop_codon:yes gene_type:complete
MQSSSNLNKRSDSMSYPFKMPETGFLRLKDILAPRGPIPISKSTWWAGVKDGRFPKPLKLGARVTVWRAEDIRDLIATGVTGYGE